MQTKPKLLDATKNGYSVAAAPIPEPVLPDGVSYEQATQIVEANRQARAAACMAEINQVLEKYGCTIVAQTLVQAR